MPELPEVETVCRGLIENIQGQKIFSVGVYIKKLRELIPKELGKEISGAYIVQIQRKAKYILLHLQADQDFSQGEQALSASFIDKTIIIHLGMSGRLTIQRQPDERKKHDHVVLELADRWLLVFNDPRQFGIFTVSNKVDLPQHKLFRKLGLEPLEAEFTMENFIEILKSRSENIKNTLMDASLIVGIGNIYASEALFRSGINPERSANELSLIEVQRLYQQIRQTLEDAMNAGGSTLKDFTKANGESGYFQYQFKVYGRDGQPCAICKNPISKIVQAGRSTFLCKQCQV